MLKNLIIFLKAQMSALLGGLSHLGIAFVLIQIFGREYHILFYTVAQIAGAVINFMLNKKWSFYSKDSSYRFSWPQQFSFFVMMVACSIFLKDMSVWALTKYVFVQKEYYLVLGLVKNIYICWGIAEICISLGFNYTIQRYWVFKNSATTPSKIQIRCEE